METDNELVFYQVTKSTGRISYNAQYGDFHFYRRVVKPTGWCFVYLGTVFFHDSICPFILSSIITEVSDLAPKTVKIVKNTYSERLHLKRDFQNCL